MFVPATWDLIKYPVTLWDLTAEWREDGEWELKQSEALREAEHQEGQSKSLSPSSFKVKVMYYCLLPEK